MIHFHGLSHMPALSLSMIEIVWEAWEFLMVRSCRWMYAKACGTPSPLSPPPAFPGDQNTISSPQAPPAREEQLKLQQIARISDNVTEPILTLFQISHFQERSQFWQIAATALSAKANLSESGQKRAVLWERGGFAWRWGRWWKTKDDAGEVMDPRWRDTINPSSWHLRSIISSEMVA